MLNKNPQLNVEGLIQTQLGTNAVDLLLVGKQTRQHISRIATNPIEQEKYQQYDARQSWDHLPQASKDISTHAKSFLWFLNVIVNPITQNKGVLAVALYALVTQARGNAG